MAYRAVFFDLFAALVRFDRDRLPEIRIKGKSVKSTAGQLHARSEVRTTDRDPLERLQRGQPA